MLWRFSAPTEQKVLPQTVQVERMDGTGLGLEAVEGEEEEAAEGEAD